MNSTAQTGIYQAPRFTALRWIPGDYSRTAIASADQDLGNPSALEQHHVVVDGCLFRCRGITVPPHAPPFRGGETMVLQLEPAE